MDDDPIVLELNQALTSAEAEYAEIEQHREAYKIWYDEHSRNVMWQLGDDVARRAYEQEQLRDSLDKQRRVGGVPLAGRIKRARTVLMVTWGITALIWAAVIARILVIGLAQDVVDRWAIVAWCAGATGVAVVVLALANHRFYRAMVRYEWDVEQSVAALRRQTDLFLHAGQERARLETLSRVLRDWVRILGEAVHRPWESPARTYDDLGDDVIAALPAAMGVARQSIVDADLPSAVVVDAYRWLYKPGFAARAFERGYERFETESPDEPAEGHRDVDLDAGTSPVGARTRLRDFWASGRARAYLSDRAQADLHEAVEAEDLALPTRVVRRLGPYSDGTDMPDHEFYLSTVHESTALSLDVFTAEGKQARRHYPAQAGLWLPHAPSELVGETSATVHVCAGPTAVRIDLSRRMRAEELTVFVQPSTPEAARATTQTSADAEQMVWH